MAEVGSFCEWPADLMFDLRDRSLVSEVWESESVSCIFIFSNFLTCAGYTSRRYSPIHCVNGQ